jgi:hypothetical protein
MPLVGEHLIFRAAGTAAFLAADFFGELLGGGLNSMDLLLDLVEQETAGEVTVDGLGTVLLALDRNPGGSMHQLDARRCLVHMLPAGAAGTHEGLIDIAFVDSGGEHFVAESLFFARTNHKGG